MNNIKSQGTKSILWDLLGKVSSHGISFLVTLILARFLEPNDFGMIAIIMSFVAISYSFTDGGLSAALIQKQNLLPIHSSSVFYFNITSALVFIGIAHNLSDNLARYYQQPILEPLVQVISLIFLLNALNSVQIALLKKQLNFALITKASVAASIVSGSVSITLAFLGVGIWSLVTQTLLFSLVMTIYIWCFSNWRPELSCSFTAIRHLWKFGSRMFLSNLLDAIYSRLDYLIIGKVFSITSLGHFQAARRFNLLIIQFTSGSIVEVIFPTLSKIQNETTRLQSIIIRVLHLLSFAVFLLLGLIYCSAYEIVSVLLPVKWLQSAEYMSLLLLAGFSYPISSLLFNLLKSRGNSKAFLQLQIIKKVLLSFNFLTLIYLGINEYIYGLIVIAFITIIINSIFASKEINLNLFSILLPILVQMSLAIFSFMITFFIFNDHGGGPITLIFLKSIMYGAIYIGTSNLFKTKSSLEFNYHISLLTRNFLKKYVT